MSGEKTQEELEVLYVSYIKYVRHESLSSKELYRFNYFKFDNNCFVNLLANSEVVRREYYNKEIVVHLHTDGDAGHVSGDLPVLMPDGNITISQMIGLEPKEGQSVWKILTGDVGRIVSKPRSTQPGRIVSANIKISQEQYQQLAAEMRESIDHPPVYRLDGNDGSNCINWMNQLLMKIGVTDGIKNKFSYEEYKKLNFKAIQWQAQWFFDDRNLEFYRDKACIEFELDQVEQEQKYIEQREREVIRENELNHQRQLQSDAEYFSNLQASAASLLAELVEKHKAEITDFKCERLRVKQCLDNEIRREKDKFFDENWPRWEEQEKNQCSEEREALLRHNERMANFEVDNGKVWDDFDKWYEKEDRELELWKKNHPHATNEERYERWKNLENRSQIKRSKIYEEWGGRDTRPSFVCGFRVADIIKTFNAEKEAVKEKYRTISEMEREQRNAFEERFREKYNQFDLEWGEWGENDVSSLFKNNKGENAKKLRAKHVKEIADLRKNKAFDISPGIYQSYLNNTGNSSSNLSSFTDQLNLHSAFLRYIASIYEVDDVQKSKVDDRKSAAIDKFDLYYDSRAKFDGLLDDYISGKISEESFMQAVNRRLNEAKDVNKLFDCIESDVESFELNDLTLYRSLLSKDINYCEKLSQSKNDYEVKLIQLDALFNRRNEDLYIIELDFYQKKISEAEYKCKIQAWVHDDLGFVRLARSVMSDDRCESQCRDNIDSLSVLFQTSSFITFHQYAISKNDIYLINLAYDKAKLLPDTIRLAYMENCLQSLEGCHHKKRAVDMFVAHPDAAENMEVEKWLEVLRLRLSRRDALRRAMDMQDDPEIKAQIETLYDEDAADTELVIQSVKKQIEYVASADTLLALYQLNYLHLGFDLAVRLFADRIQTLLNTTPGVVRSLFTIASTGFAYQKNKLHNALKNQKVDFNTLKEKIGDVSESQAADLKAMMTPQADTGIFDRVDTFLDQYNNHVLKFKLAIAAADLMLESAYACYAAEMEAKELEPESYLVWVKSNQCNRNLRAVIDCSNRSFSLLSQCQIMLQLRQVLNNNAVADGQLSLVRDISNLIFSIPYILDYYTQLSGCMLGSESTEIDWYVIFSICFIKNMIGSDIEQILIVHEATILRGVIDVIRRAGFYQTAAAFFDYQSDIRNVIFILRAGYSAYCSYEETNSIVVERQIAGMQNKILKLNDQLGSKVAGSRQAVFNKAAELFCDIKYDAKNLIRNHEMKNYLYVYALFNQHVLNNTVEITYNKGDGNGLFQSVSCYTDESPIALRAMAVKYIEANRDVFEDFIPGVNQAATFLDYIQTICREGAYADELIIRALAYALNRPIIVVFDTIPMGHIHAHLCRQLLGQPGRIIDGDPIFVLYQAGDEKYHCIKMREEMYFEAQLSKNIKRVESSRLPVNDPLSSDDKLKKSSEQIARDNLDAKRRLANKYPGLFNRRVSMPNSGEVEMNNLLVLKKS